MVTIKGGEHKPGTIWEKDQIGEGPKPQKIQDRYWIEEGTTQAQKKKSQEGDWIV